MTRRDCLGTLAAGLVGSSLPYTNCPSTSPAAALAIEDSPFEPRLHLRLRQSVSGDAHPYFHDGRWHLFFLGDRFEVHRAQSSNLVDWKLADPIHLDREHGAEISPYFVLGVVHDQATRRFRTWHGHRGVMLCHESDDLTHWTRADSRYDIPSQARYAQQRDPYVLWNEDESQWWCVMTCKVAGQAEGQDGAIAFASSSDLRDWQPRGDLFFPGHIGAPEVPQLIKIAGRWYLFASLLSPRRVGPASYWIGDSSSGPWHTPSPSTLDGEDLAAMNYGFDGTRWIGIGWIPQHDFETHGKDTWGGHFGLPRELVPLDDGRLGVRLPLDLQDLLFGNITHSIADLKLDSNSSWQRNGRQLTASQAASLTLPGSHRELAIITSFQRNQGHFILRWLVPDQGIKSRTESEVWIRYVDLLQDDNRWVFRALLQEADSQRWIELAAIPARTNSEVSSETTCQIVMQADIIEAFIDGERSLAARLPACLESSELQILADPSPQSEIVDIRISMLELRQLHRALGQTRARP